MRSMLLALAVAAMAIVSSGCCSSNSCRLGGGCGAAFNDGCPGGMLGGRGLFGKRHRAQGGDCGCASESIGFDGGCSSCGDNSANYSSDFLSQHSSGSVSDCGCSGGGCSDGSCSGGGLFQGRRRSTGLGVFEQGSMCGDQQVSGKPCRGCKLFSRRPKTASVEAPFAPSIESAPTHGAGGGCGLAGCGLGGRGCGLGGHGCGLGGHGCGLSNAVNQGVGRLQSVNHPYGGQIPHTNPALGPQGGAGGFTPTYQYPYYTTRGPRDFLNGNPPSIGPR